MASAFAQRHAGQQPDKLSGAASRDLRSGLDAPISYRDSRALECAIQGEAQAQIGSGHEAGCHCRDCRRDAIAALLPPEPTLAQAALADRSECRRLTARELHWFRAAGASVSSVVSPHVIRAGRVGFEPCSDRYFPMRIGAPAFIMPIHDGSEIIDLAAWAPTTGQIGTRLGVGGCVGQGQIGASGRGTTGAAMPVFRDVVGWLRANRCGLVIADWRVAAHCLSGITLKAEDADHAAELADRLHLPSPVIVVARPEAA